MFDIAAMTPKSEFNFWFKRENDCWHIYKITGDKLDHHCDFYDCDGSFDAMEFGNDFAKFKETRPEYTVGRPINAEITDIDFLKTAFDKLITGAILMQYEKEDVGIRCAERFIKYLHGTDFYTAPGSIMYHDAEPTGLLRHSLRTYNNIIDLLELPKFSTVDKVEAYIAALIHDLCKIGIYKPYMRNVKNDETGVWEKVPSFKREDTAIPFGHGTTSMFMAQKFFKLTMEQALAIRWHMGRWNSCEKEAPELCIASAKYPMVHLLQYADQLSITDY